MTKIPIFAILFIVLSTLIVVLWQRQPKPQIALETELEEATKEAIVEKFTISPADGAVVNSPKAKFTGKSENPSLVVIYSNDTAGVAKTHANGEYELELSMTPGLNLIEAVFISPNLEVLNEKSLSVYFIQKDVGTNVAAGAVKSIFDNLITITTKNGEKNIRTNKSTNFDVPVEEDVKEATEEVDNIRIGDYIIVTGNDSDKDSIIAKNLEVVRADKPTLTKNLILGKVASSVRQNIFSVKNNKDSTLVEMTVNKNSDISLDGQDAKAESVTKDKNVIITYIKDDDTNLIDLIYLLP